MNAAVELIATVNLYWLSLVELFQSIGKYLYVYNTYPRLKHHKASHDSTTDIYN